MPEINIDEPSSVLSAIPAVLGFTPHASIVVMLIATDNGEECLTSVLRFNIDLDDARKLPAVAAPAFRRVSRAILVAVCGDWIRDYAITVLDALRASLAEIGVATPIRLTTPTLDRPGQWTNIDTATQGPITPYDRTAFAAETVFRGKRIAPSRDDLVAEFATTVNPAPMLDAEPGEIVVETFETLAAIISRTARTEDHPELATRAAVLIADVRLRDSALLLSVEHAAAGAALWTELSRQLTGPARLTTMALAAACYYVDGDGVRAGIALDIAASEANAARLDYPTLAQLLLTALQMGVPPAEIRSTLAAIRHRDS
jgi:hypothetical protein